MIYTLLIWLHLVTQQNVLEEMAFVFHFVHCFGIFVQMKEGDEDLELKSAVGGQRVALSEA